MAYWKESPSRPQDRVSLKNIASAFKTALPTLLVKGESADAVYKTRSGTGAHQFGSIEEFNSAQA